MYNRRTIIMARERKVFDKSTVAHYWANQVQDEARSTDGRLFFENKTIYSYGRHFPIATHYKDVVLFTLDTYSNTTAKHISEVRSACSHKNKLYCINPENAAKGYHDKNVQYWISKIKLIASTDLPKARKPEKYMAQIDGLKTELDKYITYFNVKLSKQDSKAIEFSNADEFIKSAKEAAALAKKEQERKEKQAQAIQIKYKDAWRNSQETEFTKSVTSKQRDLLMYAKRDNTTWLRVVDGNINTSKNVNIPIDVAERYYKFYNRIVSKGGCSGNCNYKMLEYDVSAATDKGLIVGCHNIPVDEIKYIANKLNW